MGAAERVPRRPVILGKKTELRYHRSEDHMEIDFELARAAFADRIYRALKWASRHSVEEFVFDRGTTRGRTPGGDTGRGTIRSRGRTGGDAVTAARVQGGRRRVVVKRKGGIASSV